MAAAEHRAEQRAFRASTPELLRVSAFIEERCSALRIPRDHALRLLLIAEELFLNAVLHGYGQQTDGDAKGDVRIAVRHAHPAEIELTVDDGAPAFNPFAAPARAAASGDPAARPVGGVGLVLVGGLTSRQHYERRDGRNVVTVAMPLG